MCFATSRAKTMSVPYFIPILNVLSFCPFFLSKSAAILATRLESNPPESKHPIGLSDMSLSSIVFVKTETSK